MFSIDMTPPSYEPVISISHKKHLLSECNIVGICLKLIFKVFIDITPMRVPWSYALFSDIHRWCMVIKNKYLYDTTTVDVTPLKSFFQGSNINLLNWSDFGRGIILRRGTQNRPNGIQILSRTFTNKTFGEVSLLATLPWSLAAQLEIWEK